MVGQPNPRHIRGDTAGQAQRRIDDELEVEPCIFDITKHPIQTVPVPGESGGGMRNQSASVMMPPAQDQKVMLIGGGPAGKPNKTDAIDNVDIVDLKAASHKQLVGKGYMGAIYAHLHSLQNFSDLRARAARS